MLISCALTFNYELCKLILAYEVFTQVNNELVTADEASGLASVDNVSVYV